MKKQDFLIIAAVLIIAGTLFALLHFAPKGKYVQIEQNGKITQTLPLNEDKTVVIKTEYGSNTLEIKDGLATVTEADCPDKICQKHSKISKSGESIICLPHKLVITITGEKEEVDIKV